MASETWAALSANKVRSGLTVLGIVIGIASVIAMVSIGQGAASSISSSISSIGSNLLIVTPGATRSFGFGAQGARGSAQTITVEDAQAIQAQVADIAGLAMDVSTRAQITTKSANTNTSITGTTPAYQSVRNVTVAEGDFFTEENVQQSAKVAVIGPTVLTDLFGDTAVPADAIGQSIRIGSNQFRVIGVTKTKGGSGFGNADDIVYIPYTSAQRYLTGNPKYLTEIDISAASSGASTQVQTDVTDLLMQRHKLTDPTKLDFSILNQADIVATAASVTNTLTYLLAAIAGISLVVGGIGIMNMMLTNVTERMREIGLRKAIGATSGDISKQFLAESVALTVIGGAIGIALGSLIALGVNATGLVTTTVTPTSILLSFGVSAAIGIIFGWYPARRAARLHPIDALRYE